MIALSETLEWVRAVGALLAGIAAVWGIWAKLWVGKLRPFLRRRQARHDIVENSVTFNRTMVMMHQWRARHGPMRALCLVARNCGSNWDPTEVVTVSVLAESHEDRVPRVFKRFQNEPCDPPYRQLLSDVMQSQDRGILVVAAEMPKGMLSDYYETQGVCASVVFPLAITSDAELVYVSLNFGQPLQTKPGGNTESEADKLPLTEEQIADHVEHARALHRHGEHVRRMVTEGRRVWASA